MSLLTLLIKKCASHTEKFWVMACRLLDKFEIFLSPKTFQPAFLQNKTHCLFLLEQAKIDRLCEEIPQWRRIAPTLPVVRQVEQVPTGNDIRTVIILR